MANVHFEIREPKNEPNYTYSPGSIERKKLKAELKQLANKVIEIPAIINGKKIRTNNTADVAMPHVQSFYKRNYNTSPRLGSTFYGRAITVKCQANLFQFMI